MNLFDELEKGLLAKNQKEWDENKRGGSHHPSACSAIVDGKCVGKCLRAQWYGWKREKPSNPVDGTTLLKFEMGNCIHSHFSKMFATIPGFAPLEAPRTTILPEGMSYPISGELDALLGLPGGDTIVEIKSAFGNGMRDIEKNGPRPENVMQLNCYLKIFGKHKGKLLYIARDSAYRREFDTVYSEELWEENVRRWKDLEGSLSGDVMPPRDFSIFLSPSGELQKEKTVEGKKYKSDWQCAYCAYLDKCWDIRKTEGA